MYIKVTMADGGDDHWTKRPGYINVDTIVSVKTPDSFDEVDEISDCELPPTVIECMNNEGYFVWETVEDIMTAIKQTPGHKNLIVE